MQKLWTDLRCLSHRAPVGYPECPARLQGVIDHLRGAGFEIDDMAADLTAPHLLAAVSAIHDVDYVERFRRAVERGDGLLDSADNPLAPETWEAVLAAVSAALRAADWMMQGPQRRPFVAVRPPGHHAERAQSMGFCFFNTVAVVAQHLMDHHGIQKLAILDFDVHHGNGTQHLFEERSDVLFVSLHQSPFYPGTGGVDETGLGDGHAPQTIRLWTHGIDDRMAHPIHPGLVEGGDGFFGLAGGLLEDSGGLLW